MFGQEEKSQHQQLFFRDMLWRFCPRPRFVVSDFVIGTGGTGACLGCTQSHSCGVSPCMQPLRAEGEITLAVPRQCLLSIVYISLKTRTAK